MGKSKKIFDILPPRAVKEEISHTHMRVSDPKKEGQDFIPVSELPTAKKKVKKFLFFVLIVLFAAGLYSYFNLSRAEIEIWPIVKYLELEERITINTEYPVVDVSTKSIPGIFIDNKETISQQFPVSGRIIKEVKAKGTIRVYNVYSVQPQTLVVDTRFIASSGELFYSVKRIIIPGAKKEEGKLIPSHIDIEVIAAEAGEDYNIGSSDFSIPGFAGTSRYTGFYGKSFESMSGGWKGEVAQPTLEDLGQACEILTEKLKTENIKKLLNQAGSDFSILNETLFHEIIATSSVAGVGKDNDHIVFQATLQSKCLAIKTEDLVSFMKSFILAQSASGRKIEESSLKFDLSAGGMNIEDLDQGSASFLLKFSAIIYAGVDKESIKQELKGKTPEEVEAFLKDQPGIGRVKVKLWPFWVNKISSDTGDIKMKLNINNI